MEAEALSFPCFQMFNSEISHPLCCQAHVLSAPPICRPPCELLLDFQISRLFGGLYKGFAFCTAGLFGFKTVAAEINGREGGGLLDLQHLVVGADSIRLEAAVKSFNPQHCSFEMISTCQRHTGVGVNTGLSCW